MMVTGVSPVVMDFGLAKQVRQADAKLTQEGSMLGTPAYMPPEQVNGDLERMGPASDIYSLGVILYELLTGRLPFEGSMAAIFGKILYTEPPSPSAVVPGLNPALDLICRKAMAKAATDRYPSMKAFAADLTAFLRSTPATAGAGSLVPAGTGQGRHFSSPHGRARTPARGQHRRFPTGAERRGRSRHFPSPHGRAGRRPAGSSDVFQMATVPPRPDVRLPDAAGALPPTEYRPTDGERKTNKKAGATTGDEGTSESSIVVVLAVSLIFALMTIAIGGVLWAAGVFRVRTADGTLVVEVNEPNPDVYVDGEKVTVAWQNGGVKAEVTVKPGTRKVELKKDGFRAFGEEVILEDHGRTLLYARLDPIKSATETPVAPTPPVDASPPETRTTHPEEVGLKRDESKVGGPQPRAGAEIEPVTRTVYLSDLDETDWSGHADFGKNGTSKTADVAVNGIKFHKGLWTHPQDRGSASVKYRLAGLNATAFVTKVAINDSTLPTIPTLLTFQVLGDGEILWTSAPTRKRGQMQECEISVKDVRVLELRVNCPGWFHGAHAVWLDPYLLLSSPRNEVEPAAKASQKIITNSIGMKLTLIPAGEFEMGSSKAEDQKASDAEQPRHHVRITRPFYMGVTEVTQGQYRNVTGQSPSEFTHGPDDLPVEQVSWLDAVAFCNTLSTREKLTPYYRVNGWTVTIAGGNGYRLPTEAEWEYACRAGTTTIYSFGNDASQLGDFAWIGTNSQGRISVGEKPANEFGLCDMHGCVFEWCWDGFDPRYYSQSPPDDPTGPSGPEPRAPRRRLYPRPRERTFSRPGLGHSGLPEPGPGLPRRPRSCDRSRPDE